MLTNILSKWTDTLIASISEAFKGATPQTSMILTIVDYDIEMLRLLKQKLADQNRKVEVKVENEDSEAIKIDVDEWTAPNGKAALVYLVDEKNGFSLGFAGTLRDRVGTLPTPRKQGRYSLILLGKPSDLQLETISSTNRVLTAKGFASRNDVIDLYLDELKASKKKDFRRLFNNIEKTPQFDRLESSSVTDTSESSGFYKIMEFLISVESFENVVEAARILPLIEIAPDEYKPKDTERFLNALAPRSRTSLVNFAEKLRSNLVESKDGIAYLSSIYNDDKSLGIALEWYAGFGSTSITEYGQFLSRMPSEIYLSRCTPVASDDDGHPIEDEELLLLESFEPAVSVKSINTGSEDIKVLVDRGTKFQYTLSKTPVSDSLGFRLYPMDYEGVYSKQKVTKKKGEVDLWEDIFSENKAPGDGIYHLEVGPIKSRHRSPNNTVQQTYILRTDGSGWYAIPEGVEKESTTHEYRLEFNELRLELHGRYKPEFLNVYIADSSDVYDDHDAVLRAAPKLEQLPREGDYFIIKNITSYIAEVGQDWRGYIILMEPEAPSTAFHIPIHVPGQKTSPPYMRTEHFILTSLLNKPQPYPQFNREFRISCKADIADKLQNIRDGNWGLDDLVLRVYPGSETKASIQLTEKNNPDLLTISYTKQLVEFEQYFLRNPNRPFPVVLASNLELNQQSPTPEWKYADYEEIPTYKKFISLRTELFSKLTKSETDNYRFPFADLIKHERLICDYVKAYGELLSDQHIVSSQKYTILTKYSALQFIDCVFVPDRKGNYDIVLMSPLHPLKMLYFLNYQKTMRNLINEVITTQSLRFSSGDILRANHSGFPDILTLAESGSSKIYRFSSDISSYWSVYVDANQFSIETVLPKLGGDVESFLRSSITEGESKTGSFDLSTSIAQRIIQFLEAHFYAYQNDYTLRLVFVNIGEGQEVVRALMRVDRELESRSSLIKVRYDALLLDIDEYAKGVRIDTGRNLRKFLSGMDKDSSKYKDLISRISYSVVRKKKLEEVMSPSDNTPKMYAHLAFAKGVFETNARYEACTTLGYPQSLAMGGLYSTPRTDYHSHGERMYIIGTNAKSKFSNYGGGTNLEKLSHEIFSKYRAHQTKCVVGIRDEDQLMKLHLTVDEKLQSIIDWLHERCNWVCVLDRHFTQEHYETELKVGQDKILLNYSPRYEQEQGSTVLLTTTSHIDLVMHAIKNHFQTHLDVDISENIERRLISIMNQLSGTWVLSSLTLSYTALRGNLGMGTAALWLVNGNNCLLDSSDGATRIKEAKILIPLGDYIRPWWLSESSARQDRTRFCDDLLVLYVSSHDDKAIIRGRIVEVKMRAAGIPSDACKQVRSTYEMLNYRFDPKSRHLPSAVFSNQELADMIDYYGGKMIRYNRWRDNNSEAVDEDASNEFLSTIIDNVANGNYEISFDWTNSTEGTVVGFTREQYSDLECESVEIISFDKDETRSILEGKMGASYTDAYSGEGIRTIDRPPERCQDDVATDKIPEGTTRVAPPEVVITKDAGVSKTEDMKETTADPSFYIGASKKTEEWGVIGKYREAPIAVNLHEPISISLFGLRGSGKSYSAGVIMEAAQGIPGELTEVTNPLTCLVFHYSDQERYLPEYVTLTQKNSAQQEVDALLNEYKAEPASIKKMTIAVPPRTLKNREKEFKGLPNVHVTPIYLKPNELNMNEWILMMSAIGGTQIYVKQIKEMISELYYSSNLTLQTLSERLDSDSEMNEQMKSLGRMRLKFAEKFLSDSEPSITSKVNRGDFVIFDLREPTIESHDAFTLFNILTRVLTSRQEGNSLILIDEAHKYFKGSSAEKITEVARELRHTGATLVIASQDPLSIDTTITAMSDVIIAHKMTSGKWLNHLAKSCDGFKTLDMESLESLKSGEAWLWTSKSYPDGFKKQLRKIKIRPRATLHGGVSKQNEPE